MMKRKILAAAGIIAAFAVLCSFTIPGGRDNVKKDGEGHVLVGLWKDYAAAAASDKPQAAENVLDKIIAESKAKGLAWDFYDGLVKWQDVVVSRNWKRRAESRERVEREAAAFGNAVVTYSLMTSGVMAGDIDEKWFKANVADRAVVLKKAASAEFYAKTRSDLPDFIKTHISNDYEYLLWAISFSGNYRCKPSAKSAAKEKLASYLGDSYPGAAYLEFRNIMDERVDSAEARIPALEKFCAKYDGRAVSLMASETLLSIRKSGLDRACRRGDGKVTSDDYKDLRRDCAELERQRKRFSGIDAEIAADCIVAENLIKMLGSMNVSISRDGLAVYIDVRNVGKVTLELRAGGENGKIVHKAAVDNTVRSYYIVDTLRCTFADDFDDGDYTVVCSADGIRRSIPFPKYSLSIAYRNDAAGLGIYVADCMSGQPVKKADLEVNYKGEKVEKFAGIDLDGFTAIQNILENVNEKYTGRVTYRCSFTDSNGIYRSTRDLSLNLEKRVPYLSEYDNAQIMTDRAAYNPGDTVRFKAVLYSVRGGDYNVLPGVSVHARFVDPDYKNVSVLDLKSNEFGSVSGEYVIPAGAKGGRYSIEIAGRESSYGVVRIRVDEFVLPTYDVEFEKHDAAYFKGDNIVIRGRLYSYSGHSVSAARLVYNVRGGDRDLSGDIVQNPDGTFEFSFVAEGSEDRTVYYYVTVKAVDQTGETQEWSLTRIVEPYIFFNFSLENQAEAMVQLKNGSGGDVYAMDGDVAEFLAKICARDSYGEIVIPAEIEYVVKRHGREVRNGRTSSGSYVKIDLSGSQSGLYDVEAQGEYVRTDGRKVVLKSSLRLLKTGFADTAVDPEIAFFAKKYSDRGICLQIGCNDGPAWFAAELHDDVAHLLRSEVVSVGAGAVKVVSYAFDNAYSNTVYLHLVGFRNGRSRQISYDYDRSEIKSEEMPLEFSVFTDKSGPRSESVFKLKTWPGVECVASVFDISTERILPNIWRPVWKRNVNPVLVYVDCFCGGNVALEGRRNRYVMDEPVYYNLAETKPSFFSEEDAVTRSLSASYRTKAVAAAGVVADEAESEQDDVAIREQFTGTLAFLPFLRSDSDGSVEFKVNTNDKLSTYCVQVFSHDKKMNNASVRRDMLVTMPVKVSVVEPRFLYVGDVCRLRVSVSNSAGADVNGNLRLYLYHTDDYLNAESVMVQSAPLAVSSGMSASEEFEIVVPDVNVLGLKIIYSAKADGQNVSDGVFVKVPVRRPVQKLVEAHSAVLRAGMDRDSLRAVLASQFTGVSGEGAEYREIRLLDMLLESIPEKLEPSSDNAFSLMEAYYVGRIAAMLGNNAGDSAAVLKKILACQNADGGFGWFEGFNSSAGVTAYILEMMALLQERTGENPAAEKLASAVKYLDGRMLDSSCPVWYSGLALPRYLYVRSMYPDVKFAPSASAKALKAFRKSVAEVLLPGDRRTGLYLKFMRASTAFNLSRSGGSLASSWGVSRSKLAKSVVADMDSFFEYVVEHVSGGMYYPNAVMPSRGMLETESYAHSLICDLMARYEVSLEPSKKDSDLVAAARAKTIADGVRLWLMVQKETQQWGSEAGFINAVNSVLAGSDEVKSAVIAVLSKPYESPFSEVRPAGNGFTVERKFYRDGKELKEGDVLSVGDKILAEYKVWSEENRSLVVLSAPRYAGLRPVEQLSGNVWGWIRPVSLRGGISISPCSYREVKSDRTIWYMEVCPEEKSTFREEFYVTSAGTFTTPAVTIESVYSPEARANGGFDGLMTALSF